MHVLRRLGYLTGNGVVSLKGRQESEERSREGYRGSAYCPQGAMQGGCEPAGIAFSFLFSCESSQLSRLGLSLNTIHSTHNTACSLTRNSEIGGGGGRRRGRSL